jgi:thymidylate synthase (FAD)
MTTQEDHTIYPLGDGIGFVNLVTTMGDDLTTVNSARVSYGGLSEELTERDEKLIKYLAENKHTSPFRHAFMTFQVKAPEFVARQWYKHIVGASFTSPGDAISHGWNEISGRYVEYEPEFYTPEVLREQAESSKQASKESDKGLMRTAGTLLYCYTEESYKQYQKLLDMGVAKEQARMVLPFNTYTEFYWTASLQAVAHFCALRDHEHAQYEIREYAKALEEYAKEAFPVSFPLLKENL